MFESLWQSSADGQVEEDVVMRDREHAEERKREGRRGGAEDSPQRRATRTNTHSESTSIEATPRKKASPTATRMMTRSAGKTGDSDPSETDVNTQQMRTINHVMQLLLQEKARAERRERGKREGTTI